MKTLLPVENITLRTRLSPEEVIARLRDNVEAERSIGFGSQASSKPYNGSVNDDSFRIKRSISYRNSFLPVITGKVHNEGVWTRVEVKMKLHSFVMGFMAFWFAGLIAFCIMMASIVETADFGLFVLMPIGMILFGVVLVIVGFKVESSKSKKDLPVILAAEREE